MEQPDFKAIAAQLRNPKGAEGIKTAIRMSENNANMITACIDALDLKANDTVLEMGPGGAFHLPYIFSKENNIQYSGVDISETMIEMAGENNADRVLQGLVQFLLVEILNGFSILPFTDNYFDNIFTANTLYFWDDAPEQAKELLRVLKVNGQFSMGFAEAAFMQQLPFTQYGFHLYRAADVVTLFIDAGFRDINLHRQKEWVTHTVNGTIEREFMTLTATK